MSEQETKISSIVVYLVSGHVKEFNEVSGVGLDEEYGIPRFTIFDYSGNSETFNLLQVQSYATTVEVVN